jgi:cytochrome c-type biogenesis protein CcmE
MSNQRKKRLARLVLIMIGITVFIALMFNMDNLEKRDYTFKYKTSHNVVYENQFFKDCERINNYDWCVSAWHLIEGNN